ncbi:Fc.00g004100.m01.CDS01 [Cosmosporella sp. VM-42]
MEFPSAWYHLLRAYGLQLLALWRRDSSNGQESPKHIIKTSLPIALAGLAIHVIPIVTSVVVILLNVKGLYLGKTIPGSILSPSARNYLLQIVAKTQELLINAGITAMVLNHLRNQLLYGEGVPLGFLCSVFKFSQPSYFWSDEFWGGIYAAGISRWRRVAGALLLVMVGIIAAFAAPSVATLLIPRQQPWDAGGSEFYLRGTMEELFPATLSADPQNLYPECLGRNATKYGVCPSGGFEALSLYTLRLPKVLNGANIGTPPEIITGIFDSQGVNMPASTTTMPPSALWGSIRGIACQTAVLAPYLPALTYQAYLISDWGYLTGRIRHKLSDSTSWSQSQYRYFFNRQLTTATRVPTVRTACSIAQNVSATDTKISFPTMPEYYCWKDTRSVTLPQLNDTPSDTPRITWTQLPPEFGSTSTGMVFESPWTSDGKSRIVLGCSVDARWAQGTVDGLTGWASNAAPSKYWGQRSGLDTPFRPPPDGSWSRITLDKSWLHALTPKVRAPQHPTSDVTTFESLLQGSAMADSSLMMADNPTEMWNSYAIDMPNGTIYLEWLTTILIADGISRYGSDRAMNTSKAVSDWELLDYHKRPDFDQQILHPGVKPALIVPKGTSFTTFKLKISIDGLSYKAKTIWDWLAIAVLLLHIPLALVHSFLLLRHRQSSESWDSITELVTLAYNSHPTAKGLRNTSSGIRCIQTYQKVAMVRVSKTLGSSTGDIASKGQAELVFPENEELIEGEDTESNMVPTASTWPIGSPGKASSGLSSTELGTPSGDSSIHTPLMLKDPHPPPEASNLRFRYRMQAGSYETVKPDVLYS